MWRNESVIRMSWTTMALVKTSKNFSVFTRIHSCITSIITNKNFKRILKILDWNGDVSQVAIYFHPWGFHCLQEPLGYSIYQVRLVFYLTLSASLIAQWALNNYQLNWIAPGNVENKNNEHMVTNKLYDRSFSLDASWWLLYLSVILLMCRLNSANSDESRKVNIHLWISYYSLAFYEWQSPSSAACI